MMPVQEREAHIFKIVDVKSLYPVVELQSLQNDVNLKLGGVEIKGWFETQNAASTLTNVDTVVQNALDQVLEGLFVRPCCTVDAPFLPRIPFKALDAFEDIFRGAWHHLC